MKLIFCILALLCPYVYGLAQPLPPAAGLKPGDQVPAIILRDLYNYPAQSVTFAGLQKQLTIVDFWASWCGACIASFSKMHELQQKYNGQLQLLMVNSSPHDNAASLSAFFKKRKIRTGKDFTLPYLVQDTVFEALFPHRTIPHCVWIDNNGKVIAITEPSAVTDSNINAVLSNKPVTLDYKNDALLFGETDPSFPAIDSLKLDASIFHAVISREKPGAGKHTYFDQAGNGNITAMRLFNKSLLTLYKTAWPEVFRHGIGRLQAAPEIAAIFELDRTEKQRTQYCYEIAGPPMRRQKATDWLAADLERGFGIKAVAEEVLSSCYTVSAGAGIQQLFTKGGAAIVDIENESLRQHIENTTIGELCSILEMILKQPVIDETGLTKKIDLVFPVGFLSWTPKQVETFLQNKGLLLVSTQRILWVPHLKSTR